MRLTLFPSRQMAIYVGKAFLLRTIAILFVLVLLLQTLDLLGESGKILAVAGNGDAEVWRYLGLRLPQLVSRFLPFSVLLATILTLIILNQNSEVIAMKGAGMSPHQILAPLFIVGLLVAGISFAFNERIVVRANAAMAAWQARDYQPAPPDVGTRANVWVRAGDNLIHAANVAGGRDGAPVTLADVTIYERQGGALVSLVRAPRAVPDAAGWRLKDARRFDAATGAEVPLGTIIAAAGVRPQQFLLARVVGDELPFWELRPAIADLKAAGRPVAALQAALWHKVSGPLSALMMPLLGAVAAFGLARSGKLIIRAVIGMALGFAYFVADNFAIAMADLGAYPPLLAAWGPFILFFLIGEMILVRSEE